MRLGLIPILGLLSITACGPGAPQDPATGTDGTGGTGENDTSAGPGTDATTAPTTTENPTTPTAPTTTEPLECDDYDDCSHLYCGYCDQGTCREGVGCCDGDLLKGERCSPPLECYIDEDCADDEVCEGYYCVPGDSQLPPCPDQKRIVQGFGLQLPPNNLALADLDADGDLDLALTVPSGVLQLAFNDGAANFGPPEEQVLEGQPSNTGIAAGDLDGDGDTDLAVTRNDPAGGLILLFADNGTLTPQPVLPTKPNPAAVHIRELSGDGFADVLVIGADDVVTRRGDAQATFADEVVAISDKLDPAATLFDFNGGGRLDVIAGILGGTAAGVWLGDGDGTFTPTFSLDPMTQHEAVLAGDLGGGAPALVFAGTIDTGGQLDVWTVNDTPQMFDVPVSFLTSVPFTGATLTELGDPGPDILAATGQPSVLTVLGDGVGGFACERVIPVEGPTVQPLLAAGDLDGNGLPDIVVGDATAATITVLLAP